MIQQWMENAPSNEHLRLPSLNVFIPTDLSIKGGLQKTDYPLLLRKSSYSRLWYKRDTVFLTPKAQVIIDFSCPCAGNSPEAVVLTEIFTELLMDYLNENAYYAKVAGLYYNISSTNNGFQVIVFGYNHKLRSLLEKVLAKIANFEVKPDRFSVIKETVTKDYQNFKFQKPYKQAMYYCSLILHDQELPQAEELEVLPRLEADNLRTFYSQMLSRTFLEFYVAGNIEREEAESMVQKTEEIFYKNPKSVSLDIFASQHSTNRIVKLERGVNYCYTAEGLNPSDENSALVHYIQVHPDDFVLNVKLQLFALIAKQPAFHQLRTVEQLGYITVLSPRNDFGIRGLQFIVQSTVKGPKNINSRVEEFLKMFESKLHEITPKEFESHVKALIYLKLEKHKNLSEETGFYWREISNGTLEFERRKCEVEALEKLTKKDLIEFFNQHIKVGAPQKSCLSVLVYGRSHSSEYEKDKTELVESGNVLIEDIFSFKRSHPLFPSFKGGLNFTKLTVTDTSAGRQGTEMDVKNYSRH